MIADTKEQLMAYVIADFKTKDYTVINTEDKYALLGLSAGIDYYLSLVTRCNLATLKEKINERYNEICIKTALDLTLPKFSNMRDLLEGERAFYIWLLKE